MPDVVPKLSATPGAIRHSGHRVGQDTRRVLTELAGLSAVEIAALAADRIITCDESPTAKDAKEKPDRNQEKAQR
jgi:hypothetical protein